MRTLLSALAVTLLATAATAQIGPPTSQRTCAANRQLAIREGAIVLDTGPSTYARLVRSGAECTVDQFLEPAWMPSSTIRNASWATGARTGLTTPDAALA